jgi:hypothetical protein
LSSTAWSTASATPGGIGFHHDPHRVRLGDLGLRPTERFSYECDFFDAWRHDIAVEQIALRVRGRRYPVCVGGARAGPPEDCGGPVAYLALRQRWPRVLLAARMAEILTVVLDAPDDQVVGELLAGHHDELADLLVSRPGDFDRKALNTALAALDPDTEGPPL